VIELYLLACERWESERSVCARRTPPGFEVSGQLRTSQAHEDGQWFFACMNMEGYFNL
jgi:hypothetical protein